MSSEACSCQSLSAPVSSQSSRNKGKNAAQQSPPSYVTQWVSDQQIEIPEEPDRLKYNSIDSNDEVRLLLLHPGQGPTELECSLFHCRISDSTRYQALSYMWGNSKETKQIIVSNTIASIQPNLWAALWHIRELDALANLLDDCRLLWIDALCINQDDIKERNHQVKLMSQIYSKAFEVLVWLGEQEHESHLAMCLLQDWDSWSATSLTQEEFVALSRLLNRDYFRRIWIVQEICLGARVTVYCGLMSVNWENIQYLLGPQFPPGGEVWLEYEEIKRSLAAQFIRHRRSANLGLNRLEVLLETFRYSECADVRDKVYALLGLASDCQNGEIEADYSASLMDVFEAVMLFPGLKSPFKVSQILQQIFGQTKQNGATESADSSMSCINPSIPITGSWAGTVLKLGAVFCKDDIPKLDLGNLYDRRDVKKPLLHETNFSGFFSSGFDMAEMHNSFFLDRHELITPLAHNIQQIQSQQGSRIFAERQDGRRVFSYNGSFDYEETESERLYRQVLANDPQNGNCVRAFALKNRNSARLLGLAMVEIEVGDQICQIPDCCLSFVVRPDASNFLKVVGSAVIVGFLARETFLFREGTWEEQLHWASRNPWKPCMSPIFDSGDVMACFDLDTIKRWTTVIHPGQSTLPICCQSSRWCIHDLGPSSRESAIVTTRESERGGSCCQSSRLCVHDFGSSSRELASVATQESGRGSSS